MSIRTVPFSARISVEDAEFIAGLQIEGANTPSDKLRALLAEARRRHDNAGDYAGALHLAQDWLAPARRGILAREHELKLHSELVLRVMDWLPESLAFLLASAGSAEHASASDLEQLERGLMERLARLMDAVLQLAVTGSSPCYDPKVVLERLPSVIQLIRLIVSAKAMQGEGHE